MKVLLGDYFSRPLASVHTFLRFLALFAVFPIFFPNFALFSVFPPSSLLSL